MCSLSGPYFCNAFIAWNIRRKQVETIAFGFLASRLLTPPHHHNTFFPQMLSIHYVTLFESRDSGFIEIQEGESMREAPFLDPVLFSLSSFFVLTNTSGRCLYISMLHALIYLWDFGVDFWQWSLIAKWNLDGSVLQ